MEIQYVFSHMETESPDVWVNIRLQNVKNKQKTYVYVFICAEVKHSLRSQTITFRLMILKGLPGWGPASGPNLNRLLTVSNCLETYIFST